MTLYEWLDGTLDPWTSRTGVNSVVSVPEFDNQNGLKLYGDGENQTQEVFVDYLGSNTKHDLRFYYNFATTPVILKFKPFSTANNFTDNGYHVELEFNPYTYGGITFSIKKIKDGITTTLITKEAPGYEYQNAPNLLSFTRDDTGLMKIYYNNNLITSVTDSEDFDFQNMVIQKFSTSNTPLYVDYINTDMGSLMNIEPYGYYDWATDDLNGWTLFLGYNGHTDYTTGDGITVDSLWAETKLERLHTANDGSWRFQFNNISTSYVHEVTLYPLLDFWGNGYAIKYGPTTGTYQPGFGTPNTIKLYKVIEGVLTELASKAITSDHNNHIITFRKDQDNNIIIKLDSVIKIRLNDNSIDNSTRIALINDDSYNRSYTWFGFVEYTPITNAQSTIKTLIDIPHHSDLRTKLCIRNLNYDLLTKLVITRGSKSEQLKTLLTINPSISGEYSNNLLTTLTVNAGATAYDLTTILLIGTTYEKRLRIVGNILYNPRILKPPTLPETSPTRENYPEDYGTADTLEEENGISIMVGGRTYV